MGRTSRRALRPDNTNTAPAIASTIATTPKPAHAGHSSSVEIPSAIVTSRNIAANHSATPFDLAQTIGSSLAVIGGCLVLLSLLPPTGARFMAVLFGAGTMTLSLYSLHVWMRTHGVWPPEEEWSMFWYVLILGVIGAVFAVARVRGPLEAVVARIAR